MDKRGAYFFVLDALIGGAIFIISLIVIISSFMNAPQTRQTLTQSDDIMNIMMSTKIIEFRNDYVEYLKDTNQIVNHDNTIFEQIVEFHYEGMENHTYNLTKSILNNLIGEQYGISYGIVNMSNGNTFVIYNRSMNDINNSRFVLTSRRITFYAPNETVLIGPDVTELRIWN